jgi:hypothetical protein
MLPPENFILVAAIAALGTSLGVMIDAKWGFSADIIYQINDVCRLNRIY